MKPYAGRIGKPLRLSVLFCLLAASALAASACSPSASAVPGTALAAEPTAGSRTADAGTPNSLSARELAALHPGLQDIFRRGKLVVAMYAGDRPPFFYTDTNGEPAGGDVDLAKDIARELGVAVEFDRSADTFDGVVDRVAAGEADLAISKLSMTLSRARKVKFSEPYFVLRQALLINRVQLAETKRENDDIVRVIADLGLPVGVRGGTSFVEYAKVLFAQAPLREFDDTAAMIGALEAGELFAVLYDENEIKKAVYDRPELAINLKIALLNENRDYLAVAVAPGNDHLLYWINLYFELRGKQWTIDEWLAAYGQSTEANLQ